MSTQQSNPYAQPKAATMATRSLVSAPPNPSESTSDKPPLQRTPTDNYERAAAAAATKASSIPATTAGSVAASVNERPGVPRQQSWKISDFKGQQQGQMVAGRAGGQGYSTTEK